MIRKLIVALVLGCSVSAAQANDSAVQGVGGSLQPLKGEHSQVRMVRETVRLDIYRNYYDVNVRFIFHNDGRATVTAMGFPEGAYGDVSDENKTAYRGFKSKVDGRVVKVVRHALKGEEGSQEYRALWVKKVPFKRGQSRSVEVSYRAPLGQSAGMGINRFAAYDFTGGNWRGKVDRSDLICVFHTSATSILSTWFGNNELAMRRDNRTWKYSWTNWEAQGSFVFRFSNTLPGWMLLRTDYGPLPNWEKGKYYLIDQPNPPLAASIPENQIDFRPPAFRQNGVTYVALNELAYTLSNKSDELKRKDKIELGWKNGTATLHINGRVLSFAQNSDVLEDSDSQTPINMVAKSQIIGGRFYAPLAPIMRVLGGSIGFAAPNQSEVRNLELSLPAFWARG